MIPARALYLESGFFKCNSCLSFSTRQNGSLFNLSTSNLQLIYFILFSFLELIMPASYLSISLANIIG